MNRSDIKELHFITPIENISSILRYGILSHNLSQKLHHRSVAMPEIQDKRRNKKIPNAGNLHDYANLYFDAHNPMLSRVRDRNNEICILHVTTEILDLPGVIIADQNAASDYVRFYSVSSGLTAINKDMIFARYWTHPENQYEEWAHKSIKCAEVLVPDKVEPEYIKGAYVANETAAKTLKKLNVQLTVIIKGDIFF